MENNDKAKKILFGTTELPDNPEAKMNEDALRGYKPSKNNTMDYKISVNIKDIKIDDRYYSFNYRVSLDGKVIKQGEYSDSHDWRDNIEGFRKMLNDGYALQLAIDSTTFS